MKPFRIFFAAIMCMASLAVCATNAKIDKLIKDLEKSNGVEVTFTEKRDPATKSIYSTSYLIKFHKSKGKSFLELFEKERENSVEATKSKDVYSLSFIDGDIKSTYVLISKGDVWTLTVEKRKIESRGRNNVQYILGADGSTLNELRFSESEFNNLDLSGLDLSGLDTSMLELDRSMRELDASMRELDASMLELDASMLELDAAMREHNANMASDLPDTGVQRINFSRK